MSASVTVSEHVVAFGEPVPDALFVPLRAFGGEPPVEVWTAGDDLLFGSFAIEAAEALEETARETYAGLIEHARAAGYPYFVRMWNYVGDINAHDDGHRR